MKISILDTTMSTQASSQQQFHHDIFSKTNQFYRYRLEQFKSYLTVSYYLLP